MVLSVIPIIWLNPRGPEVLTSQHEAKIARLHSRRFEGVQQRWWEDVEWMMMLMMVIIINDY